MTVRHVWITRIIGLLLVAGACALPALADDAKDAKVDLSTKDVQGQALTVPAQDRPTVLVFVRMDQPQSQKTMEQVTAAVKDLKAQVIAVISGDQAPTDAVQLSKNPQWTFPVVSDPDYALSGKLSIYAWPSTVMITSSGDVAAHIGGYPPSFAAELAPDLEFAAGKIDRATLTQRTTAHDVVADSADQKAGRHVQVARRLLDQGMPDAAKAELAKALEIAPKDPALQLDVVRLQIALGDLKPAEEMLAKIDPQAVPPAQLNLLHGQIALRQEKWDDALHFLTDATELNPDPADAFYGLGLVYQHNKDWPHAADAFQKAFEATPQGRALAAPSK